MPIYEMPLLLRVMQKPETAVALKRVCNAIFARGGIIRKIDNLGQQPTPYKTSSHNAVHREASYFIIHFHAPPRKIEDLLDECSRDSDIIRNRAYKKSEESPPPCTWHDEMLPTAYRPEVQKLVEIAANTKRGHTVTFKYNSGMEHYPFQK